LKRRRQGRQNVCRHDSMAGGAVYNSPHSPHLVNLSSSSQTVTIPPSITAVNASLRTPRSDATARTTFIAKTTATSYQRLIKLIKLKCS